MKRPLGKLSVLQGRSGGPVRCLLERLAEDWELQVSLAASGDPDLVARLAREEARALLVVDHPATRSLLGVLRQATEKPIVYVLPSGRPTAADGGFGARRRAREEASWQACVCDAVWILDGKTGALDRKSLNRRLLALRRGGSPQRAALTSIIIPCFNRLRYTRECLRHLRLHARAPYEVIAIDNGSSDGTAAFLRSQPCVRLVRNARNLGFAKAVNQGMSRARGRYLVWLNNDAVVTPHWLEGLIACAERAPWIGAVGPYTNEAVGFQRLELQGRGRVWDEGAIMRFSQALALKNRGQARPVHRLVGFCLLLKREAARQVGLLDERFGTACYEDYDYCLRLRLAGYDLALAQDVFVYHHGHKSFQDEGHMLRHAAAGREVFLDKWCDKALGFLDDLDPVAARAAARS